MRRVIYILMCLSMASMVPAISTTNGDFEALGIREDVPDWFEHNDTWIRLRYSPNGTQYMRLGNDNCWAYQSIGFNTEGLPALQVQYDIGRATNEEAARDLFITVSIYETDGSFAGSDGSNIHGAAGVTLIDSVTTAYPAMDPGEVITDSVTLQYLSSAGGELFLRFRNEGDEVDDTDDVAVIDNVQIVPLANSIVSPLPEDGTEHVAVALSSPENDLVFYVVDPVVTQVDVRFATDPNEFSEHTIVDDMPVSPGQYTVTLETELTQDLDWSTKYFWQVLAYEPNGMEVQLKYTSPIWSYTTMQEGPGLGDVTPGINRVSPGEDAQFSVSSVNADTFQWYKKGDPNVVLSDGDPKYSGTTTATLTVHDVQLGDEGFFFCVATETATGLTAQSPSFGELFIKELKAYYPFEETYENGGNIYTYDTVGGKDMQLIGGASLSDADPIIGKHLLLVNPGNQWARIIDSSVADYENVTISFWFKATTLDRWAPIFEFGTGASEYIMFTPDYRQDDPRQNGLDVARCEFRYYDDENVQHNPELDVEHPDIAAGRWYHVAITIQADEDGTGARGRIYLGGQHGTEAETPQVLNVPKLTEITKTLNYIGQRFSFTAPTYNGRIDEFKIYNYAKTSEEIAQEYLDDVPDADTLCDMEKYDLYDYDYDFNCRVDLADFAEIAAKWLDSYRIFPE